MRSLTLFLIVSALRAFAADAVPHDATGEKPIQMRPFEVVAPGIDIKVIYDKNQRIVRIEVTKVLPNSRAEKAGLTTSMWITQIQGIEVSGLTKEELLSKALQQPVHGVHVLSVIDLKARGRKRDIRIPAAEPERK